MSIFHALILGIVQGFTEFLPISSSGHLVFVPLFFGWPDHGLAFDVVVHLGTLVAVVWYFRKQVRSLCLGFFSRNPNQKKEKMVVWSLFIATIPALVAGLFFELGDSDLFRSAAVIGWSMIIWGILLGLADRYATKQIQKSDQTPVSFGRAAVIGCAQAVALIPGTSRSGITMTAGLFLGLSRRQAAEFSFLLSIPIIAIAGAVEILQLFLGRGDGGQLLPLVVGFFAAAISGWLAIALLMKIIMRWNFLPFVCYRIVVGALILFLLV